MRSDWSTASLGELVKFSSGGTPSKKNKSYWSGNIPWISARNFKTEHIHTSDLFISQEGLLAGSKIAPVGSFLLLTRGSGLFNSIPLGMVEKEVAFNQDIKCINSCSDIENKFIFYWLLSIRNYLMAKVSITGIGAGKFDMDFLLKLQVPIPPKSERTKIIHIADSLSQKIELNQRINDNLQKQTQALFKEWFIDNPDSVLWQEGTFSNLIERTISGDWGKDGPSGNNTEMVYCIRGADIPDVRTGNKGKMPTRYILPKNYTAKQLVHGDIVVEISGGSPTQSTGRAAAISTALLNRYDKGMICTNFCKALKPIAGYGMYVYYYWLYLYDMGVFFSYENGTTGIKNLDINGFIETEPISIAPADLVKKFDIFCQSVFSTVYANGLENQQLSILRDTILPKLMTGEIDVSHIQL